MSLSLGVFQRCRKRQAGTYIISNSYMNVYHNFSYFPVKITEPCSGEFLKVLKLSKKFSCTLHIYLRYTT